jgi:hypothetical protein
MNLDPKMEDVLYHYTSHKSLRSIVEHRHLRISHVYYMNDENEIKYGAELLKTVVADRQNRETDHTLIEFLIEFREWLNQLIGLPHYIFVFSLTEKGNILSQWRAYTPSDGAGVSIGFSREGLKKLATERGFELIKCLYDKNEQLAILNSELDTILTKFIEDVPSINTTGNPPNQKFASYCYQHSEKLLKIFCRIKDPYFQEEKEWRLVSKYYVKYTNPEIKFRDGRTTLIPYIEFPLAGIHDDDRLFEQVYVGPSPNFNLAYSAIVSFLSNTKVCSVTINSQSPLRQI